MSPHRVGFLRRFGLETGILLTGIGYDFQGNYKDCMNVFIISIPNELERKRKMNLKWVSTICCLHSNLSNDNIISAKKLGLKTSMDFRDLV